MNDLMQRNGGDLMPVSGANQATVGGAMTRQAQEVQAAMTIAKKFPRDVTQSFARIMQSCKRRGLAESALYAYPKGGTTVTGPSIRMAEALAQAWGNLDFGIIELEQANGESQVMAYCWDLETNVRDVKVFTVRHERHTRNGKTALTDPRDVYEMVANQGARRLRACILSIIPGDVVDSAIEACEQTLRSGTGEPIGDRARKMVVAFGEIGVSQDMIEKRLGHKIEAVIEQELVNLRKIFGSIKDGAAKREDFFDVATSKARDDATEKLGGGKKPEHESKAAEPGAITDDQRAAIAGQFNRLKFSQDEKDEVLSRYGVKALSKLTAADADRLILDLADCTPEREPGEEG